MKPGTEITQHQRATRLPDSATCAVCGKVVPFSKSRLFFVTGPGGNGTLRTCQKGPNPH